MLVQLVYCSAASHFISRAESIDATKMLSGRHTDHSGTPDISALCQEIV
jgi:hypothetical protein